MSSPHRSDRRLQRSATTAFNAEREYVQTVSRQPTAGEIALAERLRRSLPSPEFRPNYFPFPGDTSFPAPTYQQEYPRRHYAELENSKPPSRTGSGAAIGNASSKVRQWFNRTRLKTPLSSSLALAKSKKPTNSTIITNLNRGHSSGNTHGRTASSIVSVSSAATESTTYSPIPAKTLSRRRKHASSEKISKTPRSSDVHRLVTASFANCNDASAAYGRCISRQMQRNGGVSSLGSHTCQKEFMELTKCIQKLMKNNPDRTR